MQVRKGTKDQPTDYQTFMYFRETEIRDVTPRFGSAKSSNPVFDSRVEKTQA